MGRKSVKTCVESTLIHCSNSAVNVGLTWSQLLDEKAGSLEGDTRHLPNRQNEGKTTSRGVPGSIWTGPHGQMKVNQIK